MCCKMNLYQRTHHMWKESSTKSRWDVIERNVRMYEKTGVWTFDERIMQIQLKSFGIECNLDCHMCNHDFPDLCVLI